MKNVLLYFSIVAVLFSCTVNNSGDKTESELLFAEPKTIGLNTTSGYSINPFTTDTIQPLLSVNGEPVISGKPVFFEGEKTTIKTEKRLSVDAKIPVKISTGANSRAVQLNTVSGKIAWDNTPRESDTSGFVLKNSTGKIIQTGVPFQANFKEMPFFQPEVRKVHPFKKKDLAFSDIKFWDIEEGLTASTVLSVMEDRNGNMWYGTLDGGALRFNGETLALFNTETGLCNNDVWDILEDRNGNIWFATAGGVCCFNGNSFLWLTEAEGLPINHVLCVSEDSRGNIWLGTNTGGAVRISSGQLTVFSKKEGLSHIINEISEDSKGNLWFSSYTDGVFKFDGKSFRNLNKNNGLTHNSVFPLFEDSNGNIWIGTMGGGIAILTDSGISYLSTQNGLCNNFVNSIAQDDQGNIWIGTSEGLCKFDGQTLATFTEESGLNDNDIFSVCIDSFGKIWMGTWEGGVNLFNTGGFENYTEKNGLGNSHVLSVIEDKKGDLWLGTWNGISRYDGSGFYNYNPGNGFLFKFGTALCEDSNGNIWVGSETGGICRFDGKTFHYFNDLELLNNTINSIVEDNSGNIWIATERDGLFRFDGSEFTRFSSKENFFTNSIKSLATDKNGNLWVAAFGKGICKLKNDTAVFYTEKEGLSSNSVLTVFSDSKNNIWMGTKDGGLNRLADSTITCFTTKNGLNGNNVVSVTEDRAGNIWVGTSIGMNLITRLSDFENKETFLIYPFGTADGLKALDFNHGSILADSKNNIWAGTGKALACINPDELKPDTGQPRVKLNRITVNETVYDFRHLDGKINQEISFDKVADFFNYPVNPSFSHQLNHLTFYFSAYHHPNIQNVLYSYRILELNDEWSIPLRDNKADYQNLPYGINTLQIRAISQSKKWSEPFEYRFTILPPWWKTNLAKAGYTVLLLTFFFALIFIRTNALNRRKNELSNLVEELKIAQIKSEESDRLKSAFLANMSHEIRTPMNGILGFTNLLQNPNLTGAEQQSYIDIIKRSGDRLLNTVNDIIEISKIETGQVSISLKEVNIKNQLKYIFDFFNSEVEAKGLKLFVENKLPENENTVKTDEIKLNSILTNLVKNAIKYTRTGYIELSCERQNDFLVFHLKDTGIGIPIHRHKAIFDRFVQADIEDRQAFQGSGLGLSIVKSYVAMLGGKIWLESEIEKGSTFHFSIQFIPVKFPAYSKTTNKDKKLNDLQNALILVAEDDPVSMMYIESILAPENCLLLKASNGKEAVEVFENNPGIDLILMDLKMPVLSGYEATKMIRKINRQVPIIAQTAYALSGDREVAIDAGCNDYISKPINKTGLIQKIIYLLQKPK